MLLMRLFLVLCFMFLVVAAASEDEEVSEKELKEEENFDPFEPPHVNLFNCGPDFGFMMSKPVNGTEECYDPYDCLLNKGMFDDNMRQFDPYCVYNTTVRKSYCCLKPIKHFCSAGFPHLPLKRCSSLIDCNDRVTTSSIGWCDKKWQLCCEGGPGMKIFCSNSMYLWATAPVYDRNCAGVEDAGKCCPPFKGSRTNLILPERPFQTTVECDPNVPILNNFQYGFCPYENGSVIWVFGQKNYVGEDNVYVNMHCESTRDCGQDGNDNWYVCVKQKNDEGKCFRNPLVHYKRPAHSPFWYYMLAFFTGLGAISVIIGMWADFMYRMQFFAPDENEGETSAGDEAQPMLAPEGGGSNNDNNDKKDL